ncbi:hypothetical protein M513_09859 [Trichuris suis]|uniref:Uncharacterized protein n=1 Tax=Trichuris suis TaxID=68888 RepID=A0A085LWG1_9BILA|nr:hypothetical protein M513_09859 [Trichuris suis]
METRGAGGPRGSQFGAVCTNALVTATAQHLEAIFYVRVAHEELLGSNDTAFQSREVSHMAERWGVLL